MDKPVDDLAFIHSLVASGDVVGALPPISQPAAERRAEVEAAIASGSHQPPLEDVDSDSSSEFESEDEVDGAIDFKTEKDVPMSAAEHAAFKAQLDAMAGQSLVAAGLTADDESSEESDDEYDLAAKLGGFGMEMVDDEDEPTAIVSAHEVPLPTVKMPPIEKLPEGEKLVLAGDVVSWTRAKGVEGWWERKRAGAVAMEVDEVKAEPTEAASEETVEGTTTEGIKTEDTEDIKTADALQAEAATESTAAAEVPVENTTEAVPSAVEASAAQIEESKEEVAASIAAESPMTAPAPDTHNHRDSGTVVIRAMQEPGTGWLEEGSVLCFSDGRVLGTVADTFGPLTSPFYVVRLPPPPYPYPSDADLESGARIYFPAHPAYRSFVDMYAVRDPRFASDASNVYDEEVGDEEMEWSDDEAEAAAKRAKKRGKGKARGAGPAGAGPGRPLDYGDGEAGEVPAGPGGRRIVSYADERPIAGRPSPRGRGGGRGRGQGRDIGQGRDMGRHGLPPRPSVPYNPAGYSPAQPGLGIPGMPPQGMGMGMGMPMGMQGMHMPMGMAQGYPQMGMGQMGMGGYAMPFQQGHGQQQQYAQQQHGQPQPQAQFGQQPQQPQQPQGQGQQGQENAPAINPRFAAQYMMGGYWPQNQYSE